MVKKINLKPGKSGGTFKARKPLTEGVQEARICRIVELGMQEDRFGGDPKHVLSFAFELADDKVEFEGEMKPAFAFKDVNVTVGEKATLTKLAIACGLGTDEINLDDFLGKAVSVTITNRTAANGNIYSNITSISGLSERVAKSVPDLVADSYFFDFDNPDVEVVSKLGKGMKNKISKALNYSGSKVEKLFAKLDTEVKQTTSDLDNGII